MNLSFLPLVNASLNALAFVLLCVGMVLIKKKNINGHRNVMIAAFVVSCLFLVSYVTHYAWRVSVTGASHTKYEAGGFLGAIYRPMLLSHIVLAALVPVLAILTIRLGLKRLDARHRKLAKITLPIWMYVSVTGVLIYVMLYHFNK
ncbi:MAG: DUF420 domain-containing protein [Phycisphaeraceae bacterium]